MQYPGRLDTLFTYIFTITFCILSTEDINIFAILIGAYLLLFPFFIFQVNPSTSRILAFSGLVMSGVLLIMRIY